MAFDTSGTTKLNVLPVRLCFLYYYDIWEGCIHTVLYESKCTLKSISSSNLEVLKNLYGVCTRQIFQLNTFSESTHLVNKCYRSQAACLCASSRFHFVKINCWFLLRISPLSDFLFFLPSSFWSNLVLSSLRFCCCFLACLLLPPRKHKWQNMKGKLEKGIFFCWKQKGWYTNKKYENGKGTAPRKNLSAHSYHWMISNLVSIYAFINVVF